MVALVLADRRVQSWRCGKALMVRLGHGAMACIFARTKARDSGNSDSVSP